MPRPGFLGGNAAKNVQVVGNVGLFVKLTGDTDWIDMGNLNNVEIEPTAEFLEYSSNRRGINAVVKRILTSRALTVNAVLEEVNPDNLRFAFLGTAPVAGSVNIIETAVLTETGTDTVILPEAPLAVLQVYTSDGGTDVSVSTDPTTDLATDGVTLSIDAGHDGEEIHVVYSVALTSDTSSDVEKIEILASSLISGVGQLRIRNDSGGLAQVYELDSIEIAPNGAIGVPAEEVQSLPVTLTVREKNGMFGRVYTKTIASS